MTSGSHLWWCLLAAPAGECRPPSTRASNRDTLRPWHGASEGRTSMGTRIPFQRPDGKEAQGYLAHAGAARARGVVVIQEWWGLQDQITNICDRLALAGYDALAPDLYD